MKKFIKIFFITVGSLVLLLAAAIGVILWLVFTPAKLTPIVQNQANKYLNCQTEIEEVELTFFSTFPQFALNVKKLTLINPFPGAPSDTLLNIEKFMGAVDIKSLWKLNEIKLSNLSLQNGNITLYTNRDGKNNYTVFETDTVTKQDESKAFGLIDLGKIDLQNINARYVDELMGLDATIQNLYAKTSGSMLQNNITGNINIANTNLFLTYIEADSIINEGSSEPGEKMNVSLAVYDLSAQLSGAWMKDSINGDLRIDRSGITFNYNGEKYLDNASVQIQLPVTGDLKGMKFTTLGASANINSLILNLSGTFINNSLNQQIYTDLSYHFNQWPVKTIMEQVPPSYQSYISNIDADGLLSSNGKITGVYSPTSMPLMDINLTWENGALKYQEFPIPLHKINTDVRIYTDLKDNAKSFIQINQLSANTPQSTLSTTGSVTNLFGDIFVNLNSTANLTLDEFNPVLPSDLKVNMIGKAQGKIKSAFSLSQIQKMELDKIKLSGNISVTNLDLTYDSLWVKTDLSKIDLSLPNHYAASPKTKFAFAKIIANQLEAGKINSYGAFLKNADISLETSDARDTTRIPDLICAFKMDSLHAVMDTISLSAQKPIGKISIAPGYGPTQPKIELSYKSNQLEAAMGHTVANIEKLSIETNIVNDNSQKDIFLQWLTKGFINMDHGYIAAQELKYPILIPSIKMDFEPETFNIHESSMVISNSDFELKGKFNNILSYFRGDSLLRGDFSFTSSQTDLYQLMNLTNGLGYTEPENQPSDQGPYMVPKGVDVSILTNIKNANYLTSKASDIKGTVTIKDGILVLDELKFITPAARIQLTAMYRTPRKNHIYLGLDYHMLNVEIAELLQMIPEIDSLMPMLRSFGGKGEFHMAIETYMDSTYNLKTSTLLGAASISGKDLVLMDGETFSIMAKKLRFKKKTQNRIKSLFAEFTIFRDEIDVYPLLIEIDKYAAIVGGRHNTDMTFDYFISVVESPLPFRLGLTVSGNIDKLKYRLGKPKYAKNYRPVERGEIAKKQLELRNIIREALTRKVKD